MIVIAIFIITIIICSAIWAKGKYRKSVKGILGFFYPLSFIIFSFIMRKDKNRAYKKTEALDPLINSEKYVEAEYCHRISVLLLLVMAICIITCVVSAVDNDTYTIKNIDLVRNNAGEGTKKLELIASNDDGDIEIDVDIRPEEYTYDDVYMMLEDGKKYILHHALGENQSWNAINSDLVFIDEIADTGIKVSWKVEDLSLISQSGRILAENIPEEGISTRIIATLELQGIKDELEVDLLIIHHDDVYNDAKKKIVDEINLLNGDVSKEFVLPEEIDGIKYSWSKRGENRAPKIAAVGFIGIVALIIAWGRSFKRREEIRKKELTEDYPIFIHQLVLYINSGMNMLSAIKVIKNDCEGNRKGFLYQELSACLRSIENGTMQSKAYENFGKRCGIDLYVKLSSLMIQFVNTGAIGMNNMFEHLAYEANVLRREESKRTGETAGTRLLIPLMLLLIVAMLLVIYPAFISMNM